MYTRGEIRKIVEQYVITDDGVTHISDMLEEIQNRMFSVIRDRLYYTPDKFIQSSAGQRNSKFVELCASEKWEDALTMADYMNKVILEKTPCFQNFVKEIKASPDYVSTIREMKLRSIL
jgi:hypothetical protein